MDWKRRYITTHESTLPLQQACQADLLEVEDVGVVPSDEGQRIRMMVALGCGLGIVQVAVIWIVSGIGNG